MKVVLLAGGLGTRLAEETEVRPKPMVEIGGRPILWHIMKHFSHYGHNEFYIALGYKGEYIKRYFLDYLSLNGTMSIDMTSGKVESTNRDSEDWVVNLVDTGTDTPTGSRVHRLRAHFANEPVMVTYGDGVCDIDLDALLRFHKSHGKLATVTAVRPPARFGELLFDGDLVTKFTEKPQIHEGWINGGFLVLEPAAFEYLYDRDCSLEIDALSKLARDRQLSAYRHENFWQCMDTLRDKRLLENLWDSDHAPWKVWT
jgi:glucose-1-phosphate cytidylyltransferase